MRDIVPLNGDQWQLCGLPQSSVLSPGDGLELPAETEWLPARVPGNVRGDLWRLGRIADPHISPQDSDWVDQCMWCYRTRFCVERAEGQRIHLVLEGTDYISWLYLNGRCLSPASGHEGMFSRQLVEITDWLREENTLSVLLQSGDRLADGHRRSGWERLLDRLEPAPSHQRKERFQTTRCQMSFGWDFAPCVRTGGLWDDVYLIRSGDIVIRDLWVKPRQEQGAVSLDVCLEVDTRQAEHGRFRLTLSGCTFASEPQVFAFEMDLQPGTQMLSWTVPVQDPHLWWPWDHGMPNLYRFVVEAYLPDDALSDVAVESLGLRWIEVKENPGAPPGRDPWAVCVNGEPVYVRGANWVPADILYGEVTDERYRALLQMARNAHMNALRVWGGGLREKRAFYETCDEMGLLVWQEFPFACAFVTRYPRNAEYLDLVEQETRATVRALRNHACVVLWCGGNEINPSRHQSLLARIRAVVEREDGTRPFSPASPYNGDIHNWEVWHGLAPITRYATSARVDSSQFVSEYGLQSVPVLESLQTFIPPEELWPPGPAWRAHGAQWRALRRYAEPLLGHIAGGEHWAERFDLAAFVEATQRAQAIGLQIGVEHLRRLKARCSGTLIWQLNEPWPAISWSLVDYYGRPKPAYEAVRRAYSPLLAVLEYPIRRYQAGDRFRGVVWVLNDRSQAYPGCCVEVTLRDAAGEVWESWLHTLGVEPDSVRTAGQVEWELPEGDGWTVVVRLLQGEGVLAENQYDLAFHDAQRFPLLYRVRSWLSGLILGGQS